MSNTTEFTNNDAPAPYVNGSTTAVESQDESEQWVRPSTQRDLIIEHLRSGKTLTQKEAEELYGCNAIAAVVHWLKKEGLNIVTERFRNEKNRSVARYRLVEDAETSQPAEKPAQPSAEPTEPTEPTESREPAQPQPEQQPAEPTAQDAVAGVQSLAVVMDADGPRLQIDDTSYRLTKPQMRYLAVTMDLFAKMED